MSTRSHDREVVTLRVENRSDAPVIFTASISQSGRVMYGAWSRATRRPHVHVDGFCTIDACREGE